MRNPDELEPLEPVEAVEMYKQQRRDEVSEATLQSHGYRLKNFVKWCDNQGIDNLNDVGGRDIHRFRLWRSEQVNQTTLKSQMDTLRVFIRFCENIDGVRDGLSESIDSPAVDRKPVREKDVVREAKASDILAHHDKYSYAGAHHAITRVLWETGMRAGAARSIDLDDLHLREEFIELHHRPEQDTPLKNKEKGERSVAVSTRTVNILRDYIKEHRHDVTDDYDRKPLFTTEYGRITKNTFQAYVYRLTRPCMYGQECPHDRNPDDCEAVQGRMSASKCPDSVGPHAFRRGAITHFLGMDTPGEVVSDRLDVSKDVIDEHYDSRTEREKMELRRRYLDNI
ncbi:phage integrase/site-specific recombinase [Haloferax elongans ATCC BAA-1513]|uniref:Phage integrase/site-specific recombinase n=1 Tax=Haloferax elongans ATCC BAA-1513 TaxID=1230453 RepID=M0HDE3_HALEO|nr:site-specific integrase [Haloferax elongans]ELZ81762.1 phage integrase/site-specific recombinase [Haloferax elongans ATCC BAA-1513]